jgi:uncharacterized protein
LDLPSPRLLMESALALVVGAVGAGVATAAGLPLPILLGSLVLVAGLSVPGWTLRGVAPRLPQNLRLGFVPIVGVSIGGAFHPGLLAEAQAWWPSLLGLALYVPAAHWVSYQIYRKAGGLDPVTALYAGVPGGLMESISMGEQAGADVQMMTMLHFLRLIGCILLVPLGFWLLTGQTVGSSAGVSMPGSQVPLGAVDVLIMIVAGVGGALGGKLARLPGYIITGPVLVSGAAHLLGWTEAVPPQWLIQLTQLVVGASLGCRFAGMPRGALPRALRLAALSVAATLALGFAFAAALHGFVGQRVSTVLLAFAPGGVAEMSLVALSLHVSVVFVTAHHVARIVLSVAVAGYAGRKLPGKG